MKKLFKTIHPIFFWISMTIVSVLFLFIISINYKIIVVNCALAAEIVNTQISKNIIKENSNNNFIECDCEKRFNKSYPVIWSGQVIATFVSGEDIGVEKYDKEAKYNKFYVDAQGKYNGRPGHNVRVTGMLVGITCAYANTVFEECVAEVEADKITLLN